MTKRFEQAMTALTQAYFDGTLGKGACAACAVGNMVAHAHGKKVRSFDVPVRLSKTVNNADWQMGFCTRWGIQGIDEEQFLSPRFRACIDPTGYAPLELARVENAFESTTNIDWVDYPFHTPEQIDADQLAGLYAVVEVLCELEGIADPQEYKAMFARPIPA